MAAQPTSSMLSTLVTNTGATIATCVMLATGAILSTDLVAKRSATAASGAGTAAVMQPAAAPAAKLVAGAAATPIDPKLISPEQRRAIEQIMREYLVANPDVLIEAMKEYEARQQVASAAQAKLAIIEKKSQIFRSPVDVVLGNPNGDITVVEVPHFRFSTGVVTIPTRSSSTRSSKATTWVSRIWNEPQAGRLKVSFEDGRPRSGRSSLSRMPLVVELPRRRKQSLGMASRCVRKLTNGIQTSSNRGTKHCVCEKRPQRMSESRWARTPPTGN